MRFGSVCSGIEAASVAWHPLGWEAAWFAEIEPFPSAVLAHRWPGVPNLGDMLRIAERVRSGEVEAPDLLAGGTPCQAFSVAGLRKSLDDERGNLTLTFARLADAIDERRKDGCVVFWENVPGVLSTRDNAFGCFLGALAGESVALQSPGGKWPDAGCVHGPARTIAWRVLDAQYFGLAQRRRRVFVVASSRAGFNPAAVLFEFDGVRRDSAPSRGTREGTPGTAIPGIAGSLDTAIKGRVVPTWWDGGQVSQTLDAVLAKGQAMPEKNRFPAVLVPVAFHAEAKAGPLPHMQVRRLTPRECERLQGFPDDYTRIPERFYKAKPHGKHFEKYPDLYERLADGRWVRYSADGPRYKALGNSWAVPVVRWIGKRIARQ